jgi:hypothetical protein
LFSYALTELFVVVVGAEGVAAGVLVVVVGALVAAGALAATGAFTADALQAFAVLQAFADLQAVDVLQAACFLHAAGVVHLPFFILHTVAFVFAVGVQVDVEAANALVEPTKIANEAINDIVNLDIFLFIFM